MNKLSAQSIVAICLLLSLACGCAYFATPSSNMATVENPSETISRSDDSNISVEDGSVGVSAPPDNLTSPGIVDGIVFENLYPFFSSGNHNGKHMGYINENGEIAIEAFAMSAYPFTDGLALISTQKESFFITAQGENAFNESYDSATSFSEGVAIVSKNGIEYLLETSGHKTALPSGIITGYQFREGLLRTWEPCGKVSKYSYYNRNGNIVCSVVYPYAGDFYEGLAEVRLENGKLGYINKKGELVINTDYDYNPILGMNDFRYTHYFSEGLAVVSVTSGMEQLYGFIDNQGHTVITPQFKNVWPFSEGLAVVCTDRGVGFINHTGEMIIPPVFDGAFPFSEGMAGVIQRAEGSGEHRVGFINQKGDLVIDYLYSQFYAADPAYLLTNKKQNGLIQVRSYDDKWFGYINDKGDVIYQN